MAKLYNRARMTITSTGTGTLTLGSAVTGYQTFASAGVANGDVVSYAIEDGANWEIGTGTYTTTGTTLSRTVSASSNANATISVTTAAQVYITALVADILNPANLAANIQTFLTTPSSANLLAAMTTETGTGNLVFATSPTLVTPILGTPTSGTLTNCTGLPIATGVANLGTNVATFLTTPSSANLASAITDETGTGSLVFATSPTLTTPTHTGLKETKTAPSISTNTLTLNCALGNVFVVSLNANITTLTFSNVPTTGTAYAMTLAFTADGTARTITWGSAVKWPGGTAPTLTSTLNKVDTFVLYTHDGGTTWYAFTVGQNA